jgi:DNA-binding transcriptional MerR regulator
MGNQQRKVQAVERQRQALELRKAGLDYESIAKQLGYAHFQSAYKAVQTALTRTLQEPADEVRQLEVKRLDAILVSLWPAVHKGDVQSIAQALKVMERRARLLGLDAPTKIAPTDPTGEREYHELTDAERVARITAIVDAARARRTGPPVAGDSKDLEAEPRPSDSGD